MTTPPARTTATADPAAQALLQGTISLKRTHGLGNVLLLLPVLDRLRRLGCDVRLATRPEWIDAFAALRPGIRFHAEPSPDAVDLDVLTETLAPTEHRTDEFARLLGVPGPFPAPTIRPPVAWSRPFAHLADAVLFAPEGGHPSRTWPTAHAHAFAQSLPHGPLVLAGASPEPSLPADHDYRGQTSLTELIGLLAAVRAVVSMDSAVLHLALALRKPTVALFGGIDPDFRIRPDQPAIALTADMPCCPCNKNESCDSRFPCIATATSVDVLAALEDLPTPRRSIRRL